MDNTQTNDVEDIQESPSIEERVGVLEIQIAQLFEQHKNVLEHFRQLVELYVFEALHEESTTESLEE
tara:strand:- start:396 stop:596 length:201 start_codon:yes stop_codon:yes gene_type:complete